MRATAAFLIGGAIGYLLGTESGREQLDKLRDQAKTLWEDPRVQDTVAEGQKRATEFVRDNAPAVKEKVADAVRSAGDAVRNATA